MAQPNLSQSARKITIIHNKLNANNLINLGPIKGEKLKTVNFDPVNKFRSSPFHQLTTNNLVSYLIFFNIYLSINLPLILVIVCPLSKRGDETCYFSMSAM